MSTAQEEELPPSKLGTKDHWDSVYERENAVFEDVGDEGEVWFGESSVTKMRNWATQNLPPQPTPIRVMECGSGNGTLLLSFLTSPLSSGTQAFHLTGIDYSEGSTRLSRSIETQRREALPDEIDEEEEMVNPVEVEWRTGDLLRDDLNEEWDLVLDKGTFDALCLSQEVVEEKGGRLPSAVYPEQVAKLVKTGGFFLITSCNFTEEEIRRRWTREGLGFEFHSSVPHKSFTFGGKIGTVVCTVAFKKTGTCAIDSAIASSAANDQLASSVDVATPLTNGIATSSKLTTNGNTDINGEDELYICIDCGGTKSEAAIANSAGEIVSRAQGGTGNMAEVGAQVCYEIIRDTVLIAILSLPEKYQSRIQTTSRKDLCPLDFGDIWIGISGCDTPLDIKRMYTLLAPFFDQHPSLSVVNDAFLLGGPLLQHHAPWGIAVIAGTGSVVMGLEVDEGAMLGLGRRGGVGYLLGDDGSAFDLGRTAVRFAIDAYDEEIEDSEGLAKDMREHFGVETTPEIMAVAHDLDPTMTPFDAANFRKLQISALARPVLAACSRSPPDALAMKAVEDSAGRLAGQIVSLVRQLCRSSAKSRNVGEAGLVMGGGVLRQAAYKDVMLRVLKESGVEFAWAETVEDVAGEAALGLVEKARSG